METELIMVAHVCTVAVCISTTITSIYKLESTKIRFEMLNLSTRYYLNDLTEYQKCVGTYSRDSVRNLKLWVLPNP